MAALPAAFTLQTGKDHWEVLLRARAIETQTYLCASAQTGSFSVGQVFYTIGLKVHFLEKGGLVVPDYARGKIREYDSAGKQVREFDSSRPTCVTKMPNGGYVVSSRYSTNVVEYDRNGKQTAMHSVPAVARAMIFAERK